MKKIRVISYIFFAYLVGFIYGKKKQLKKIECMNVKYDKFRGYYYMLSHWLSLKQNEKNLKEYFQENGFKKIAIYGMGDMGERLAKELSKTDIQVVYAIDKNIKHSDLGIEIRSIDDATDDIEAVVVTATFAYKMIKNDIEKKFSCPIISLEEIIYEI